MPGKYISIGKDKKGEFFLGPKASFFEHGEGFEPTFHVGGVWIPNNRAKTPYFFRVGGTGQGATAVDTSLFINSSVGQGYSYAVSGIGAGLGFGIVNAIIAADKGKLIHDRKVHNAEIVNKIFSSLDSDGSGKQKKITN